MSHLTNLGRVVVLSAGLFPGVMRAQSRDVQATEPHPDSHAGVVLQLEAPPARPNTVTLGSPTQPGHNALSQLPTSLFANGNSAFHVKVSVIGIGKMLKTEAVVHRTDDVIDVGYDGSSYHMTPSAAHPNDQITAVKTDKSGKTKTYLANPGHDKHGNFTVTTLDEQGKPSTTFTFKLQDGQVNVSVSGIPGSVTLIPVGSPA